MISHSPFSGGRFEDSSLSGDVYIGVEASLKNICFPCKTRKLSVCELVDIRLWIACPLLRDLKLPKAIVSNFS